MKTTKILPCLGALVACVGAPSLGIAEDNCSGYYVRMGVTEVTLYNDPSSPQHMGIATCDRNGRCTYRDRDNDSWTDQNESVSGSKGTWKTVSGTGKYQNTTSSGWWEMVRQSIGPEGLVYVGIWGGTCKLD